MRGRGVFNVKRSAWIYALGEKLPDPQLYISIQKPDFLAGRAFFVLNICFNFRHFRHFQF